MRHRSLVLAVAALAILPQAATTYAQDDITNFAHVKTLLHVSDHIEVQTTSNVIRGRVVAVTDDHIEVETSDAGSSGTATGARVTLAAPDVDAVSRQRPDSLWNGAALGGVVSAAPGIIWAAGRSRGSDPFDAGAIGQVVILPAAVGAAAGALIDAAMHTNEVVYRRTSRVAVAPLFSPTAVGVSVTLRR